MNLDVGCNDFPRGDVNIDIERPKVRRGVFIKAHASYLPFIPSNNPDIEPEFREQARKIPFEKTTCFHVIEHVRNPFLLVDELLRVTNDYLEIHCPHRFSLMAKSPQHIRYFTKTWFNELLLKKNGICFHVYLTLDTDRNLWRLPLEIRVKIWKTQT